MKKIIVISLLAFTCILSRAEVLTQNLKFSDFDGISVSDVFNVTLSIGADLNYSAETHFDKTLSEYARLTVRNRILYITLDRKAFTKEVKEAVKKMSVLNLDVNLSVPATAGIQSIDLNDGAVFNIANEFKFPARVEFRINDNSALNSMKINASAIMISTINKANVSATIESDDIAVVAEGNSNLNLRLYGKLAHLDCSQQVQSTVSAKVNKLEVVAAGMTSKMVVSGEAESFSVIGSGKAVVDAGGLVAKTADFDLKNCTAYVNSEALILNLKPDAVLYFDKEPQITITKIERASVIRLSEAQK